MSVKRKGLKTESRGGQQGDLIMISLWRVETAAESDDLGKKTPDEIKCSEGKSDNTETRHQLERRTPRRSNLTADRF